MARKIDYYFTLQSPWSYIGNGALLALAAERDVQIAYRPMKLAEVFAETGGLPLAKRHPARLRYRIVELQRWIDARGLPMKFHPKHWPVDAGLADKCVIAVLASGRDVGPLVTRCFSAVFERDENLGDEAVISAILGECDLDAGTILTAAKADAAAATYAANVADAVRLGIIGAPSYVLDDEVFWGQDRLNLLDRALTTGRKPFLGDA